MLATLFNIVLWLLTDAKHSIGGAMLRVRDVAVHFRVHPATVYRWIHQGFIPAYRNGQPFKPGDGATGALRVPQSVLNSTVPVEDTQEAA
ncbi:helix-turn-helix domain-containing protein [Streptomyces zaomyceticus]|uniref:helix-turn-helix domain-containing protein n=1 Tax=Streptomyces zaomyceticus TaxID=68286 RepID=UPI0033B921DB